MNDYENRIYTLLDENSPKEVFFLSPSDPFEFLTAVILSCAGNDREAMVSLERLLSRFPTPLEIVEAPCEEIEALIHSSGLSMSKTGTIKAAAEYFVKNGKPTTREELLSIKGIGEKTASCYMQRVMGEAAVVVDIHFERVSWRLSLSSSHDRIRTMHEIMEKFDRRCWNRLSDTVNLLGRTFCRPKAQCGKCFLSEICRKRFDS